MLAEEQEGTALGTIYGHHTPIKNEVSIENYRVEQKTDYEKLIIEIVTDGSTIQRGPIKAAKILIHHFMLFSARRSHWKAAPTDIEPR